MKRFIAAMAYMLCCPLDHPIWIPVFALPTRLTLSWGFSWVPSSRYCSSFVAFVESLVSRTFPIYFPLHEWVDFSPGECCYNLDYRLLIQEVSPFREAWKSQLTKHYPAPGNVSNTLDPSDRFTGTVHDGLTCAGPMPCSCSFWTAELEWSSPYTETEGPKYITFPSGFRSLTTQSLQTVFSNTRVDSGISHRDVNNPPADCCLGKCTINADKVRILYWPVETDNTFANNITKVATPSPYTTVLDGFTL